MARTEQANHLCRHCLNDFATCASNPTFAEESDDPMFASESADSVIACPSYRYSVNPRWDMPISVPDKEAEHDR